MSPRIKQRLMGAFILLGVLGILLPVLFHESRPVLRHNKRAEMPAPPDSPQVTLQLPKVTQSSSDLGVAPHQWVEHLGEQDAQRSNKADMTSDNSGDVSSSTEASMSGGVSQLSALTQQEKPKLELQQRPVSAAKKDAVGLRAVQIPPAWVISVGAFAQASNAKRLLQQLQDRGFDAFIRKQGGLMRVYVGPIIDHAKVLQIRDQLNQHYHLKGVVQRYKV